MKYQDFLNYIKEQVAVAFEPDTTIYVESIKKNNGIALEGLIIRRPGSNISPAIYLNSYYHRYLEGTSLNQIVQDILFLYHRSIPTENFDVSAFTDFAKVKPQIIFKLINYERNLALLKEIPHIRYLDLAIVFQFMLTDVKKNHATVLIHNHHLDYWKVSTEELLSFAHQNTPRLLPSEFKSLTCLMIQAIESEEFELPSTPPMYILTNKKHIAGASAILYQGLLGNIAKDFQQDLVILPSSIHEVLLLPVDSPENMSFYSQMVRDVNSAEVSEDEILSNRAYYYSRATGEILF